MNKILHNNNELKSRQPSTWLGKLLARIKRFFDLPHNYVWISARSNEASNTNKQQPAPKLKDTSGEKPKNRLGAILSNPLHPAKDRQRQTNGQNQSPNTSFPFRHKPINGQKPRHRGRIK
jgi:hypothetical protein